MEKYTPFGYYRTFLNTEIYKELDKFYFYNSEVDILESFQGNDGKFYFTGKITKRDIENHIIEFTDGGDKRTTSLEENVKEKLSEEIYKTVQYIESGFETRLSNPIEVQLFGDFLKIGLNTIKERKAFNEFPFLSKYFSDIEEVINIYSIIKTNQNSSINNSVFSFILTLEDDAESIGMLSNLYSELRTSPPIIVCSKEEFINAFTGKEVNEGINWLVIGKNKLTNKIALFYFIEKLIENRVLAKSYLSDLNKYVKYVFRDKDGKEFKNLKQSKSTISNNPASKDRIDTIISSL
jgi:hypothetical protein